MTRWFRVKRYRVALFLHACRIPIRWGDRSLGGSREMRNRNIRMMSDRWDAMAPKPADFGLPPDTAPSAHMERQRRGHD